MDHPRSRREFLRLGATGLCSSLLLPSGALAFARAARPSDRTLVLVELMGGNDGLNTVVPFADDRYHRARPTLRHAAEVVRRLDDHVGFAPALDRLWKLFQDGQVSVLQGVGMQHPDRSHFTSLDRWHLGDPGRGARSAGWLARALAASPVQGRALDGLALGDRSLPLVLRSSGCSALACNRLEELAPSERVNQMLASPQLAELDRLWGDDAARRAAREGRAFHAALQAVLREKRARPLSGPLGAGLEDVLRCLAGGLALPAFFVRLGGFDTHARQKQAHADLLAEVDRSVAGFHAELRKRKLDENVLLLVYSEFGRRVRENGSAGTDHGSAAPVLMLGGGIPGGVHGRHPDLTDLDDGDVRATTDFRRPLAQCLKHLGHADPRRILGTEGVPLF